MGGEHDRIVQLIIVERLVKAGVLVILAIGFIVAGRLGLITELAEWAQDQLLLAADRPLLTDLVVRILAFLGNFPHQTALGLAVILYALIEGTEGVGLWLHRRWAEYLTVLATGFLIPYEVVEVLHRLTLLRVGGLALNVAVVVYLAWRKRLFVDV